jgi:hypothetical protein
MVVPVPFVVEVRLYAVIIWVGASPLGPLAAAGLAMKSGLAVQSLFCAAALAVDGIAWKLNARIKIAKTMKALALFPLNVTNGYTADVLCLDPLL